MLTLFMRKAHLSCKSNLSPMTLITSFANFKKSWETNFLEFKHKCEMLFPNYFNIIIKI